jgi:hypothetical protein
MSSRRRGEKDRDEGTVLIEQIDNAYGELWENTLSPSAKLADGSRHYHQHNLFGHW